MTFLAFVPPEAYTGGTRAAVHDVAKQQAALTAAQVAADKAAITAEMEKLRLAELAFRIRQAELEQLKLPKLITRPWWQDVRWQVAWLAILASLAVTVGVRR